MPALVVIGHLATNESVTPRGRHVDLGGSAYYFATGASLLPRDHLGIVACVGRDLELSPVRELADMQGVTLAEGPSPYFTLTESGDGRRTFQARWGTAQNVNLEYPTSYLDALHVHLATAPPWQQARWLEWLRDNAPTASVSADAFEDFARRWPDETRSVLSASDLAFLNDEEFELLDDSMWWHRTPFIKKHGKGGATFTDVRKRTEFDVTAATVEPVDTTGAGDVLAGSFLALALAQWPRRDALEVAATLASVSVQEFGMGPAVREQLDQLRTRVDHQALSAVD